MTAEQSQARNQRDLYFEMRRSEDASFNYIPIQDIRSSVNMSSDLRADPNEAASMLVSNMMPPQHHGRSRNSERVPYECITQHTGTLDQLFIGVARGSLCLWESGSTINWIARMDGYPSHRHAMEAASALFKATNRWNTAMDGRVRFQYVTRFDDACFQLVYGGNRGAVFASAFFPDQWRNSLNTLYVFDAQFTQKNRPYIVNTFLHELGHVLGLRHEHSHSGVPGWLPPEDRVNGAESIVWGTRNPRSVMVSCF